MTEKMRAALDVANRAQAAHEEVEARAAKAATARHVAERAYWAAHEAELAAHTRVRAATEWRHHAESALVEVAAAEQLPPLRSDQRQSVSPARVRRERFERRGKGAVVVTVTWRAEPDADLGVRLVLDDQTERVYRGGSYDAEQALATLRYLEERAVGGER